MKKIVLLSGTLELSGSTTWLLALHEAMRAAAADVVHIVVGEKSKVLPGGGRVFHTGRARRHWRLRCLRLLFVHRLFPGFFRAAEDAEYGRWIDSILRSLDWKSGEVCVIKDFTSYTPVNFRGGDVVAVVHQVLTGREKQIGMLDGRHYCSRLVAVSEFSADAVRRQGLSVERVIGNPLDLAALRARAAEFEPGFDFDYIVFVGRLHEDKGVLELLEAFARLESSPRLKLVYVGDGKARAALGELASSLGIEGRVVFAGYQANPYPYMRRARLLALPSKSEAMPYVVLEASALDVPCLMAGFPAAREFFEADAIVPFAGDRDAFVAALAARMTSFLRAPRVLVKDGVLARMEPKQVAGEYLALAGRSVQ